MMRRKMKSSTHIEGDFSEECSDPIPKTKTPICSSLLTLNEGTTMVTMIPKPFVETRPRCPVPQTWMINNYFSIICVQYIQLKQILQIFWIRRVSSKNRRESQRSQCMPIIFLSNSYVILIGNIML